jgi:hypothetical protein
MISNASGLQELGGLLAEITRRVKRIIQKRNPDGEEW